MTNHDKRMWEWHCGNSWIVSCIVDGIVGMLDTVVTCRTDGLYPTDFSKENSLSDNFIQTIHQDGSLLSSENYSPVLKHAGTIGLGPFVYFN